MKACSRSLVAALALVVGGAFTAPAASAQSPSAQPPPSSTSGAVMMSAPSAPGAIVSVTPARIADSRVGLQIGGAVPALGTAAVQVTGRGGIPGGSEAVVATVTVVAPQYAGYVTVWPSGTRPETSNVNFQPGQNIANTVIIRVSRSGGIRLFNGSPGSVQLIVDVTGYIASGAPTEAGAVVALTPARVVDSRINRQIFGPLPMLGTADMQIGGQGGIPLDGVAGGVATLTVVDPQEPGYLTLWPSGSVQPDTSSLNFQAGETIATTVIVPVSSDFALRVFNGSFGVVQVLVDVTGYTLSGTRTAAGTWIPVTERIADSRSVLQIAGPVDARRTVGVSVAAPGSEIASAVLTVTAVGPMDGGYVTVWPSGTGMPGTSSLNFQVGKNIATTVIVPVGADGVVQLFNGSDGPVDLIVDFRGYTLPTIAPAAGAVWAWGAGERNELGTGVQADIWVPVRVSGLSNISAIAGGGFTGYGRNSDALVTSWGYGFFGQLGNGGTADGPFPVQVSWLANATALAGGMFTGYALRADGTVWAWGDGEFGQLGKDLLYSAVPVQVALPSGITAIASGGFTGYALRNDGTVWAWGKGDFGALGNGTAANSNVPVQVFGLTGVTAIAGGSGTGYAVDGNHTLWAWGEGFVGQLGNDTNNAFVTEPVHVSGLTGVTAVAAGSANGYALLGDGTVWSWGSGYAGALGTGTTANSTVPVQVSELTDVTAIAGGGYTGYALRTDETVWAWGYGHFGQMGNGSTADVLVPAPMPGLSNVIAITAGSATGYAISH